MADLYDLGDKPPVGLVPKRMHAFAVRQNRFGQPREAWRREVLPTPTIGPDEVLIYVMASGINFNNVWAALGAPLDVIAERQRLGEPEDFHAGGSDCSGIVWAIGNDVRNVEVGDEVMVSLPGAGPVQGRILRTGRVANVADQNDPGRPPGPATITVIIGITVPAGTPDLDQAQVLVAIAASVRENVTLVPVAALLARPGGGYQVRLASGDYVEVRPGLFDEATGKVEVSGALTVGDMVEVPVT